MLRSSLLAVAACAAALAAPALRSGDIKYSAYLLRHGKVYSPEERAMRSAIYRSNVAVIEKHNGEGHAWRMGVNKFTDLTVDEFNARFASSRKARSAVKPEVPERIVLDRIEAGLPQSVNWTAAGAVTPVQDQGQCGSCWAFTTVAAIEGAYAVQNKSLVKLSEQQVVSCDKAGGNDGCNGGEQITAIDWVAKGHPLCSEEEYPYKSGNGNTLKCETTCKPVVSISKGVELPKHNMTVLLAAIANWPISLSVDASGANWQNYAGGVMNTGCKCSTDACLDHAVTGVGYGVDATSGEAYYLIKNSWGSDWGEAGFIRIARGPKYDPAGYCGVQIDSAYAQVY